MMENKYDYDYNYDPFDEYQFSNEELDVLEDMFSNGYLSDGSYDYFDDAYCIY